MDFATFSTQYLFPGVIFIVMFGLGLSLTPASFASILQVPRAVLVGLAGQMVFLPAVALGLALLLPLPEPILLGLVILAACPGGSTSNAIVFALRGETALSVTLTALSSVLSIITIPFIIGLGFTLVTGGAAELALPAVSMMQRLFMMTGLPILLGMIMRYLFPTPAVASLPVFRVISLLLILTIIAISVRDAFGLIEDNALKILGAALALALLVIPGSWLIAHLARLDQRKRVAITVEVGVQNTPLALVIGATLLGLPELNIVPVAYGILNYLFIGLLLLAIYRLRGAPPAVVTPCETR
ncbi:MAG: bile acid:sodium symporter [Gammaproteobacteria bacterium]|nr:bile acid:sodium symporter [Gammaproteobacteria bacterium]